MNTRSVIFIFLCALVLLLSSYANAQVGIGTTTPVSSSILELKSTSEGFLVPRMTLVQKSAIITPANGLMVYQIDGLKGLWVNDASTWKQFLTNGDGWTLLGNTGTVAGTNFIGTTDAIDLVTKTNGVERMRVTSSGNIGIGTTTPNRALNVVMNSSGTNVMSIQNSSVSGFTSMDCFSNSGALATTFGFGNSGVGALFAGRGYINSYNNDFVFTRNGTEYTMLIKGASGFVGINNDAPGSSMDIKGTLRLSGSTSGYVGFAPAAAAGSTTYTLPTTDGTNGQQLSTNGSGTLSWTEPSGAPKNYYQAIVANPGTTNSSTVTMMGLAGSIAMSSSNKFMVVISGDASTSGNSGTANFQIYYGSGSSPSTGDAVSGTPVSSNIQLRFAGTGSAQRYPFACNSIVTGLTPGQTYWVDIGTTNSGGNTITAKDISISIIEL